MRRARLIGAVVCAAFLLAASACRDGDSAAVGSRTAAPVSASPRLVPRECASIPGLRVDCHWLIVPLDRARPEGASARVAVAVLRTPAPTPEPDPVVFLQGGPGQPSVERASDLAQAIFLQTRDVVLVDQRGVGLSQPRLDCPEVERAVVAELGRTAEFARKLDGRRRAYRECRDRLERDGIDLDQFDTEASAADLADLRVALGVDEWNLWAVSYGTRLALATMRSHPAGVRSVILDSPQPPTLGRLASLESNTDAAFTALDETCDADATCTREYPDLRATVDSAVAALDAAPFSTSVDLGEPFGSQPVIVDGAGAYADLVTALADSPPSALVPPIARGLAEGQTSILGDIARAAVLAANAQAEGAFLSFECADSAQTIDTPKGRAALESPGVLSDLVLPLAEPYCADWGVEPLGRAFNKPVRSDVPTLILSGTYDPLTPASNGELVAKTLDNVTYVAFDGLGHGLLNSGVACVATLSARFVASPNVPLDTSCAREVAPRFDPL